MTQVGLLALGVFGYFYTVLPVFQNQQLQEQTARLELEKSAAQRRLDEILAEQEKIQNQIATLRRSWDVERAKNAQLTANANEARKQEIEAIQHAANAENALAAQAKALDSARWEQVILDFFFAYSFQSINSTIRNFNKRSEQYSDYIRAQEAEWPQPYKQLLGAVNAARTKRSASGQIPAVYYAELQSFIDARKENLQCTPPDFAALEASYQLQLAAIEPSIETDVKASINKLIKEYSDNGKQVEITDAYRESVRLSVRFGKVFQLEQAFDKRIEDMRKSCDDKARSVIEELRKLKGVTS